MHGDQVESDPPAVGGGPPPVGALALNALWAERDWSDALVKRLQPVARVFTNALARKRAEEVVRENEARLAAGADLAGLALYEVDFRKSAVGVDDRFRALCGVPADRMTSLE